jgi:ATP-binding cassette, subfamily B, bacterial
VSQMGDHESLMAQGGLYKRLYEAKNVDPRLVRPRIEPSGLGRG